MLRFGTGFEREILPNIPFLQSHALIVTGIRRCGKSTMLELFQDYLRSDGVADEQIIYLNLEDGEYDKIE